MIVEACKDDDETSRPEFCHGTCSYCTPITELSLFINIFFYYLKINYVTQNFQHRPHKLKYPNR